MKKKYKRNGSNYFKCPVCGELKFKVVETRRTWNYIRRTRECLSCKERFNTAEINIEEYKTLKKSKIALDNAKLYINMGDKV